MGTYNSAVITNGGQSMIAQAVAGASLEFTTIKTSSYAYPAGTNLATLTTINAIKQSKDITGAAVYNSRVIKISAAVDNTGISTAYAINTIGIYAKVGSSAESLFAVVTASAADTMPAYNSKPYSYIYEINLTMQNAANVTVTVNAAGLVNVTGLNAAKVEIEGEIDDLNSAFDASVFNGKNVYDTLVFETNNTKATSNNDGTYTISPGDYGRCVFGEKTTLTPGCYKLFGVPQGMSYLSVDKNHNNVFVSNSDNTPKRFVINSETDLYLCYRIGQPPASAFIIEPFLYQTKIDDLESETDEAKRALNNLYQRNISLSGNYFDRNNATWFNGRVNANGNIVEDDEYRYAFAPLQGAGHYIKCMRYGTFGNIGNKIHLYDADKVLFKIKDGTHIANTDCYEFDITAKEALTAAFVSITIFNNYPYIAGLFYDSENYNYVGTAAPNANFGTPTNKLYKKTLICDGDSICAAGLDNPYGEKGWFGRLKNNFSMVGKNFAVGGGAVTNGLYFQSGDPRHCLSTNIDAIHQEYPTLDYLLLEGGTNDADLIGQFSGETPPEKFGSWSESDFSGNYDNTTFCGAVDQLFYKAVTYYPTAKIGFIVAMEMGTGLASLTNRKRYFDEAEKIAKKWHIPVLNLWENVHADARLNAYYDSSLDAAGNVTAKKFYNDGQHPTSYGYDLMQPMIETWVESL